MTSHSDTSTRTDLTLILGANGKTGRRIAHQLAGQGRPIRLGSRSGSPAFDWHSPSEWGRILRGVAAIYISYHPDLAAPGAANAIQKLVEVAKIENVQKLVLLSGRGEEEAQRCEQIVLNSGIPATVLRCAWFNQNFSENFMRDFVMNGTIALPVSTIREPFIDVDDIADVAVAALTEDGHDDQIYELTGPDLLSFPEVAAEISKATNRQISFHEIPPSDFRAGLDASGLPGELSDLIDYLFTEVLDGRNESLGDGVARALGRPPRTFAEYARRTSAQGLWND